MSAPTAYTKPDGSAWVPACDVYECTGSTHVRYHAVSPAEATRRVCAEPGLARTLFYFLNTSHPLQQEAPAVLEYWRGAQEATR